MKRSEEYVSLPLIPLQQAPELRVRLDPQKRLQHVSKAELLCPRIIVAMLPVEHGRLRNEANHSESGGHQSQPPVVHQDVLRDRQCFLE